VTSLNQEDKSVEDASLIKMDCKVLCDPLLSSLCLLNADVMFRNGTIILKTSKDKNNDSG
jgi:hypothetical protein